MKTKQFYSIVVAENFEKTLEFYRTLGFRKTHEVARPFGRMCTIENEEGALLEIMEKTNEKAPSGTEMEVPGLAGVRTNVEDLDAAVEEFRTAGAKILAGPMEMSVGRGAVVEDPNGVRITVIQHIRGKK